MLRRALGGVLVAMLLALPATAKKIDLSDDPAKGAEDAPLTLVEFGNFQCPACFRCTKQVLPEIEEAFVETGQVRLVFLDLPLEMHPRAFDAAVAAQCAGRQGRFWLFHDRIFTYLRYTPEAFLEFAQVLQLDLDAFSACLDDAGVRDGIEADIQQAEKLRLSGTPSFALVRPDAGGGAGKVLKTFRGCPPLDELGKAISKELDG